MLLGCWFIFLFISFLISILMMNFVQIRFLRRQGWRKLFGRRLGWRETLSICWTDLSPIQRILLWTGLAAFMLTIFGAAIATILQHLFSK